MLPPLCCSPPLFFRPYYPQRQVLSTLCYPSPTVAELGGPDGAEACTFGLECTLISFISSSLSCLTCLCVLRGRDCFLLWRPSWGARRVGWISCFVDMVWVLSLFIWLACPPLCLLLVPVTSLLFNSTKCLFNNYNNNICSQQLVEQ